MNTKIVLVVLNYNDSHTTINYVKEIEKYKDIDCILIVDNCSTDDSYEKLKGMVNNRIVCIKTDHNGGYAFGNNCGARYAIDRLAATHLVFSNPDVHYMEGTILSIIDIIDKNDNVGVATGIVRSNTQKAAQMWKMPSYIDCVKENFIVSNSLLNRIQSEILDNDRRIIQAEVVPGSFFAMKSLVWEKIGGFDERTFLYYEENILAYRLKENGYFNYVDTNTIIEHEHSVSINKSYKSIIERMNLLYRSKALYCREYLKIGKIRTIFLFVTYKIGIFNYVICKTIVGKRE